MSHACAYYRVLLVEDLTGGLPPDRKFELESHLTACPACVREQLALSETVQSLRTLEDEPVPRHFFVHPETDKRTFREVFASLPLLWKGAWAASLLALLIVSVLAASQLQVRADQGVISIAFGRPLPAPVDAELLKGEILREVAQRLEDEDQVWVSRLRREWESSNASLKEEQRQFVEAVLHKLEERVSLNVQNQAAALQGKMEESVSQLFEAVSVEHERDLARLNVRVEEIALRNQIRNHQADAILTTLVEMASVNNFGGNQ